MFSGMRLGTAAISGTVLLGLASPALAAQAPDASPSPPAPTAAVGTTSAGATRAVPDPRPTPNGPTCRGRLLDGVPVGFAGETVGTLNLFYEGGFNCATVQLRTGAARRVAPAQRPRQPFVLYVALQRCEATKPGPVCRDVETVEDEGPYVRRAGAVRVFAPAQCIRAEGRISLAPGLEAYAETRPGAAFCG